MEKRTFKQTVSSPYPLQPGRALQPVRRKAGEHR
jgi:hypothetical protein